MQSSTKIKINWPIGLKIFSIAASLLFLMASVTYLTTRNLEKLNGHLNILTNYFIPLDQTIGDIQLTQMSQRMQHERMLLSGLPRSFASAQIDAKQLITEAGGCSREQLTQALRNTRDRFKVDADRELVRYVVYRSCGETRLFAAQSLLKQALSTPEIIADSEYSRQMTQIDEKLKQLDKARINLNQSIVKQFEAPGAKEPAVAAVLTVQVSDHRKQLNQNLREVSTLLHTATRTLAVQSTALESTAFKFSWSVTIFATLLGLVYTALLTRSLVRPVSRLVDGVQAIQDGDLTTHLLVTSKDEIGMLTQSFNHMAIELKEKEVIKDTFGKYVDPRIVKTLLERGAVSMVGERQEMTIQFSDIEGFTRICEQLTPEGTVKLLNQYFTLMSQAIREHLGIVDKYIGDAVMGFWGPPFCLTTEHASFACFAALEQVARLEQFNLLLPDILGIRKGLPRVNIRIGLCAGDVTLGSIGSETARSFTVIGDTVNQASRIEQANKQYGTQIIISESTHRLAQPLIEARELDLFLPTGKEEQVRIFELLGRKGQVGADILELRQHFETGLAQYREKDWTAAIRNFETCLKIVPTDKPSVLFLSRATQLLQTPPPSDWDGVWRQRN
jgi:adenylate cyclase